MSTQFFPRSILERQGWETCSKCHGGDPVYMSSKVSPVQGSRCPLHSPRPAKADLARKRRRTTRDGDEPATKSNYILEDCLGRGAHGAVYRARDRLTGELVAVKQVDLDSLEEGDVQAMTSEVELLRSLNHPNIVQYKGSEQRAGQIHIALEYCQNGSLRDVLKRFGKAPAGLAASYVRQVVCGLDYLHQRNVVHRDIKAANVLALADGSIKLADFGLAIEAGQRKIQGTEVVGSPYWMAPEVVQQQGSTPASDIWSVGCLVYELLTGHPPYHALEPLSALFNIVTKGPPPLPDDLDAQIGDFLRRCFESEPVKRATARQLLCHPWLRDLASNDDETGGTKLQRLARNHSAERTKQWVAESRTIAAARGGAPTLGQSIDGATSAYSTAPDIGSLPPLKSIDDGDVQTTSLPSSLIERNIKRRKMAAKEGPASLSRGTSPSTTASSSRQGERVARLRRSRQPLTPLPSRTSMIPVVYDWQPSLPRLRVRKDAAVGPKTGDTPERQQTRLKRRRS
ncbi:unnamed protein product [Parajaminaea phylloscopi]